MQKFIILEILLQEPVKTDLTYISGSTIKGAYIRRYISKHNIKEDIALNEEYRNKLLSNNIKFFNAYPYTDKKFSIPTPLCFYAEKDEYKKFGKIVDNKEYNTLKIKNEFYENIEEGSKRINMKDFSFIDKDTLKLVSSKKIENLHTRKVKVSKNGKIDNEDKGDLFRYIAIDKKQRFYSIIQCNEENESEIKQTLGNDILTLYLGGSKGSGYGRCEVKVISTVDYDTLRNLLGISYKGIEKNTSENYLSIYFLSDAIIKNKYGQVTSHISEEYLQNTLNISNVEIDKCSVMTTETKGYNSKLKSNLPTITAIKKGSILTYKYSGELKLDTIKELEIYGVGSRREDGYGRIIINPNFVVKACEIYKECNFEDKEVTTLDKDSKIILSTILNNINKERTNNALAKLVVESYENEKVKLGITNAQLGRFIQLLYECDTKDDRAAKDDINKFKESLKTKTARDYANKNKNQLFGYPLYIMPDDNNRSSEEDYLDILSSDKSIKDIILSKVNLDNIFDENLNIDKLNNFRLKLKFTRDILAYELRKRGGLKNER